MTKRKMTLKYISFAITILLAFSYCFSVCATDNLTTTNSSFDYGPIVYVENENQLPLSMRNNIAICNAKNSDALTMQKEALFNEYLNNKINKGGISSRIIIMPLLPIVQNPQETNFYCGYSAMQSILEYHGIFKTQIQIASESYSTTSPLAWFAGTEAQNTDWTKYPAAAYLSSNLNHAYRPFNSYFGTFTETTLLEKVRYNTDEAEEAILVCGESKGDNINGSKLPNYPSTTVSHWIVIDGYFLDTDTQEVTAISFVDPAKSDEVSWSEAISAYSETTLTNMFKFATGRGIIW